MNFSHEENSAEDTRNILDAPKVPQGSVSDNIFSSDYDQGWLDGYTTGVLDASSRDAIQDGPLVVPGDEVDSERNPSSLENLSVPSAQIVSREVRGIRGPWGDIIPAK